MRIPRTLFLKMLEGYPDAAQEAARHHRHATDQSAREIYGVRTILDARRH